MDFTAHMEQKLKEARIKNLAEVRKNIHTSDIQGKIMNHIERWDGSFSIEEIEARIMTDDLVASLFAVNPLRQNICEKEAITVLGTLVEKMASQGKNCVRFTFDGDIVSKKGTDTSESADCLYLGEYYATLKYTKEEGGAQNNQYEKVNTFLRYGSINHKVAAIVDGPYWDTHRASLMEAYKNNPNVIITSVTEITENI